MHTHAHTLTHSRIVDDKEAQRKTTTAKSCPEMTAGVINHRRSHTSLSAHSSSKSAFKLKAHTDLIDQRQLSPYTVKIDGERKRERKREEVKESFFPHLFFSLLHFFLSFTHTLSSFFFFFSFESPYTVKSGAISSRQQPAMRTGNRSFSTVAPRASSTWWRLIFLVSFHRTLDRPPLTLFGHGAGGGREQQRCDCVHRGHCQWCVVGGQWSGKRRRAA